MKRFQFYTVVNDALKWWKKIKPKIGSLFLDDLKGKVLVLD